MVRIDDRGMGQKGKEGIPKAAGMGEKGIIGGHMEYLTQGKRG